MKIIHLNPVAADTENIRPYGTMIDEQIGPERMPIPFYDHVDEGTNIPFEYTGKALLRTARIHPSDNSIVWMERHVRMTQFFVGLGESPFGLVLATPSATSMTTIFDIESLRFFVFRPGTGVLLHKGTWHDFPLAIDRPVTCLTGNSDEVVRALVSVATPREMNEGDVFKVHLPTRLNLTLVAQPA
ncbi:ureidoglycolate lyase [Rhizobium sp. FKL33]|uniref:ureidoglycolate lyase n=1 Tax=Rhizobium sp. FKL33 TaxID=2562307 RepID=UPI0010C0BE04|nr:ureidoglycolate lyase [Rhizobium sp. FKL33]